MYMVVSQLHEYETIKTIMPWAFCYPISITGKDKKSMFCARLISFGMLHHIVFRRGLDTELSSSWLCHYISDVGVHLRIPQQIVRCS